MPPQETKEPAKVPPEAIPLSDLDPGQGARVISIAGEARDRQRILEIGLVPDAEVRVSRTAPFGDPIEIDLRGASFSIRRAEAKHVLVRPNHDPARGQNQEDASRGGPPDGSPGLIAPIGPARVVVLGNPNVGKTSLFNALTGHHAQVSNYPGSTVDHRVGQLTAGANDGGGAGDHGTTIDLVDVPGTYTLNAHSDDERVAIAELLGHTGHPPPDAAIVVLRYATLERGLYFLMQVQELGIPLVAVVNMMDESRSRGCPVDLRGLAEHFGIPFVGTVATSQEGVEGVRRAIIDLLAHKRTATQTWHWHPSDHLMGHLDEIAEALGDVLEADASIWRRRAFALWCLMSLRELPAAGRRHKLISIPATLRDRTIAIREAMVAEGHDLDLEVTRARYAHIDRDINQHGWKRSEDRRGNTTEKVDAVLTHPVWGSLVFLVTISLVFAALFDWATPIVDGISGIFTQTAQALRNTLPPGLMTKLLADGVIMGVGAVLAFLPQILILFFFIALLESSGYMARVAFLTDRAMRKIGIHGGALVPLISGFACAVPAIMATRTIPRHRDRLLTIMVLPLISCSARLPVYTLLISAIFPATRRVFGPFSVGMVMMLGIYVLSTLLALIAVAVLGRTVLKGQPSALLLELPPYRLPTLRGIATTLGQRAKVFVKTAGTVILASTIVLWALLTFPQHTEHEVYVARIAQAQKAQRSILAAQLAREDRQKQLSHSFAGRLGKAIEPLIAPLGFDWKIGVGLIGAFSAREVFVSTMGLIYGAGTADEKSPTLRSKIRAERRADGQTLYSPLVGLSLIVFFMIAMQCVSTLAVVRQETASWRWPLFQLVTLSLLAYAASLTVYQLGRALGFA